MNHPPNYIQHDGYKYQLDKWWYNDDYSKMLSEYVPCEDIPYIDQRICRTFSAE